MRLLLDFHIGGAVARQLRARGIDALALSEWMGGNYRSAPDELIVAAAYSERRVLVTYDCKTIPGLLKSLVESGRRHAGVIFVKRRTFQPSDIGGLVRALEMLDSTRGSEDWENRVIFLSARPS